MRIGINIPNELMKRLEPLKPELNISQVCREALAAKADKYERMKAGLENEETEGVVNRLWERELDLLTAIECDWETLGYQDAAAWTKAASWDDWDDLHEDIDGYRQMNLPETDIFPPMIDGVKWYTHHSSELHQRINQVRERDHGLYRRILKIRAATDPRSEEREYMTAWLRHVKAVWELVRQRESEHLERQLARRPAPPKPEAPAHLLPDGAG